MLKLPSLRMAYIPDNSQQKDIVAFLFETIHPEINSERCMYKTDRRKNLCCRSPKQQFIHPSFPGTIIKQGQDGAFPPFLNVIKT